MAATWTAFVGWSAGVSLPWTDVAAIFLAVWILYAADRLLDANPLFTAPASLHLEERHRFHHRHRKALIAAILCVAPALVLLLHWTPDAVLHLQILLAALLGVWLLLVHARPVPSASAHRLPKEIAVGLFFPAAIFVPTVARAPSLRPVLLVSALAFAALCTLNCLFIFTWEHPHGDGHAHPTTQWATRRLPLLTAGVGMLVAVLVFFVALPPRAAFAGLAHPQAPLWACLSSTALLLCLHTYRHRLSSIRLRALADLVLLSPFVVVLAIDVARHLA